MAELVATDPSAAAAQADDDAIAPRVRVTYPDGGEVLKAKSRVTILWTSGDDRGVVSHRVQLSLDGGKTHQDLCPLLPGAVQSFTWTVPSTPGDRARIRVVARDGAGNLGLDTSNGCFTIVEAGPDHEPPEVRVLSPKGGAALRGGEEVEVSWESSDDSRVASHRLSLSVDGGASWNLVAKGLPGGTDRWRWTVPKVATTRARLRVEAVDDSDNCGEGLSAPFSIEVTPGDLPPWPVP